MYLSKFVPLLSRKVQMIFTDICTFWPKPRLQTQIALLDKAGKTRAISKPGFLGLGEEVEDLGRWTSETTIWHVDPQWAHLICVSSCHPGFVYLCCSKRLTV
jgi:hypothetical protein